MTRQRGRILEELRAVTTHPTADEIYEMVRKKLPRVSLGTVYHNLQALSRVGVIRKLPGTPMRFDGNVRQHYHIRCIHCGGVADLPITKEIVVLEDVREATDWDLVGHEIEFLGVCPQCKTKARKRDN